MKLVSIILILAVTVVSCKKESMPVADVIAAGMDDYNKPFRWPRVPRIPLPLTRCIDSYQDILDALGAQKNTVSAVVLANGITLRPGGDLNAVYYEISPGVQFNSLFDSKLSIEWRWPNGNWQLSTADVWSLGCIYSQSGQPPYTNLIKDGNTLLVNTCFFWTTNEYTGERIDYLILD